MSEDESTDINSKERNGHYVAAIATALTKPNPDTIDDNLTVEEAARCIAPAYVNALAQASDPKAQWELTPTQARAEGSKLINQTDEANEQ